MYKELTKYIGNIEKDIFDIPSKRKQKLRKIADFTQSKIQTANKAQLIFLCTHNSRRSHFCQIWAATFADYFDLKGIETFSGGTEVTAFNPRTEQAIRRAGFEVKNPGGENPHYKIYFDDNAEPLVCFSKKFDASVNPKKNFAAIMTCTDADKNCPVIPGASLRQTMAYKDPGAADGTAQEEQTYDERCRQIATEMYYMLSQF